MTPTIATTTLAIGREGKADSIWVTFSNMIHLELNDTEKVSRGDRIVNGQCPSLPRHQLPIDILFDRIVRDAVLLAAAALAFPFYPGVAE